MKSIKIPFSVSNGRISTTSDPAIATEGKIIHTLVTSPGERTGAPRFGAGVMQLLFEPLDSLILADFRVEASQELRSRISSVNILNITVEPDPTYGDNVARVQVLYQIPLSAPQIVTFRVVVPSTITEESIF